MNPPRSPSKILIMAAALLVPALGPLVAAQQEPPPQQPSYPEGGGQVSNVAPVSSLTNLGGDLAAGSADVISGFIQDDNGEPDILRLHFAEVADRIGTIAYDVTNFERGLRTEPEAFNPAGWKVWNEVPGDGKLQVRLQVYLPANTEATYEYGVYGEDEAGVRLCLVPGCQEAAQSVVVRAHLPLRVMRDPVNHDGETQPGARWGGWVATPGAQNAYAQNFVKIINGHDPAARVIVDFTDVVFQANPFDTQMNPLLQRIPLDGSIRFAVCEDLTGDTRTPRDLCTFNDPGAFQPLSASGSIEFQFRGAANAAYVWYVLPELPATLRDAAYGAAFTVNQV